MEEKIGSQWMVNETSLKHALQSKKIAVIEMYSRVIFTSDNSKNAWAKSESGESEEHLCSAKSQGHKQCINSLVSKFLQVNLFTEAGSLKPREVTWTDTQNRW